MEEHKGETVQFKKSTLWKVGTVIFGLLFVITIFHDVTENGSVDDVIRVPSQPSGNLPTGISSVRADDFVDNDPVLGDKNAPLTIVEFSDFQCPFCARFSSDAFVQIKKQYIDTGKVKFVYRDFPLSSIHPMAQKAAEASECANEQSKFWEYHDKIFLNQASLSLDSLKQWATDLKLDTNKFNNCLDSGKYVSEISNDLKDAAAAGGQGTPYFIVGEITVSGAQPFTAFQQAIESQL